jgi:hypothetical protein
MYNNDKCKLGRSFVVVIVQECTIVRYTLNMHYYNNIFRLNSVITSHLRGFWRSFSKYKLILN